MKTYLKYVPLSDNDGNLCVVDDDKENFWKSLLSLFNSDIWITNESWVPQFFQLRNGWTEIECSTCDKSIKNLLCWNVHEKTNHSVLAHLWCVTERSWLSQLAKYITQRKKLCYGESFNYVSLFVCLYFDGLMLWNHLNHLILPFQIFQIFRELGYRDRVMEY